MSELHWNPYSNTAWQIPGKNITLALISEDIGYIIWKYASFQILFQFQEHHCIKNLR